MTASVLQAQWAERFFRELQNGGAAVERAGADFGTVAAATRRAAEQVQGFLDAAPAPWPDVDQMARELAALLLESAGLVHEQPAIARARSRELEAQVKETARALAKLVKSKFPYGERAVRPRRPR